MSSLWLQMSKFNNEPLTDDSNFYKTLEVLLFDYLNSDRSNEKFTTKPKIKHGVQETHLTARKNLIEINGLNLVAELSLQHRSAMYMRNGLQLSSSSVSNPRAI